VTRSPGHSVRTCLYEVLMEFAAEVSGILSPRIKRAFARGNVIKRSNKRFYPKKESLLRGGEFRYEVKHTHRTECVSKILPTRRKIRPTRSRGGIECRSERSEPMVTRDGANFHAIPIKLFDIADNYGDTIWHSETLFSNGHGVFRPPRRMLVAYSNLGRDWFSYRPADFRRALFLGRGTYRHRRRFRSARWAGSDGG
jgi:hypothetical protein